MYTNSEVKDKQNFSLEHFDLRQWDSMSSTVKSVHQHNDKCSVTPHVPIPMNYYITLSAI